jgi:hypothetical protein
MDTITNTLSNTAISTVFSIENLDQYLQAKNLTKDTITEFTIPDDVTEIGPSAFVGCSSLKSITIPDGVTRIGPWAFQNCTSLTSIDIPAGVTEIGAEAFWACTGLTSIDIPGSVKTIGAVAFSQCRSLTSIDIPDGIKKISVATFWNCSSLTSIDIPATVEEIGMQAFSGCESLTNIIIPANVTKVGMQAFEACNRLASINIPGSVTEIGDRAFQYCTSLTSINIPGSVTKIGENAFQGCTNLAVIICSYPGQYDWGNIEVNRNDTRIISYQEHLLATVHAGLLTETNLTDLNNDEAYLIYRLISEPKFNPSWQVLETTFNERSFEQVRELLHKLEKDLAHLPEKIIALRICNKTHRKTCNMTHPITQFLTINERSSLFGQAQKWINIRPRKEAPAAQQQTDEAPAAHH